MEIGNTLKGLSYLGIGKFVNNTANWLDQKTKMVRKKKKKKSKDDDFERAEDEEVEDTENAQNVLESVKQFTDVWKNKARKKH